MAKSIFHKPVPKPSPPTPYELIEPEIVHLKKGYSIRHGEKHPRRSPPWLLVIGFVWLVWLYIMDPVMHAWYKGEAVRTYLYLRNYGAGTEIKSLVATQILNPDEIATLNARSGSFQDYYSTPQVAADQATTISNYMKNVAELHAGKYQQLDPIGRMRYLLFIRTNLYLPVSWSFLDPSVGSN
jgi:hypothetical protein